MDQPGGMQGQSPLVGPDSTGATLDARTVGATVRAVLGHGLPYDLLDPDRVTSIVSESYVGSSDNPSTTSAAVARQTWIFSPIRPDYYELAQNSFVTQAATSKVPAWIDSHKLAVTIYLTGRVRSRLNIPYRVRNISPSQRDELKRVLDQTAATTSTEDLDALARQLDLVFATPAQIQADRAKPGKRERSIFKPLRTRWRRRVITVGLCALLLLIGGLVGYEISQQLQTGPIQTSPPQALTYNYPNGEPDLAFAPFATPQRNPVPRATSAVMASQLNYASDNPKWADEAHFLELWNPRVDPQGGYTRGGIAADPGDRVKLRFIVDNSGSEPLKNVTARINQSLSSTGRTVLLSVALSADQAESIAAGVPIRCTTPCIVRQTGDTVATVSSQNGDEIYTAVSPDKDSVFYTPTRLGSSTWDGALTPGPDGVIIVDYEVGIYPPQAN